jgi:hypothetical protein
LHLLGPVACGLFPGFDLNPHEIGEIVQLLAETIARLGHVGGRVGLFFLSIGGGPFLLMMRWGGFAGMVVCLWVCHNLIWVVDGD